MTEPTFTTIFEPFRIHSVEPLRMTTREQRRAALTDAGFNLFKIHAADVLIDLLTDSGTGAMSRDQWAALQHGDESYAGSPSYYLFHDAVTDLFPYAHVIPTHQGRAAERILFSVLGGPDKIVPNNTHFDTTRANVEFTGAQALDLVIPEARDPQSIHPFKGNMDIAALERLLDKHGDRVPVVLLKAWGQQDGILVSINKGLQQQDWLRARDALESEQVVAAEVVSAGADVGVALDGDGDRCILVGARYF